MYTFSGHRPSFHKYDCGSWNMMDSLYVFGHNLSSEQLVEMWGEFLSECDDISDPEIHVVEEKSQTLLWSPGGVEHNGRESETLSLYNAAVAICSSTIQRNQEEVARQAAEQRMREEESDRENRLREYLKLHREFGDAEFLKDKLGPTS